MAQYINNMRVNLPIKRLGDGFYLFGTKKIFARIMNGKLVIRVGGGFMSVDEFLEMYSDQEMIKVQAMLDKGTLDLDSYGNGTSCEFEMSPSSTHIISLTLFIGKKKQGGSPVRSPKALN